MIKPGCQRLRLSHCDHPLRHIGGQYLDAALGQVQGVLAGAAAHFEQPVARPKMRVELPPDRPPHPRADRAAGEGHVVVGGHCVEW